MTTRAVAYPLFWRLGAGFLVAASRTSLPVLLALLLLSRNLPIYPLMLMRAFTILFLAPAAAAWIIERAFTMAARIEDADLVLQRGERRIEVPCGAIASIDPWTIPLPGSGLWLRLQSGRRFRYGLQLPDPVPLIEALVRAGVPAQAGTALRHPSAVYAHAKHGEPPRWWDTPLVKFVFFALVPTLPLFRVHQWIAYGGTWGEYYLLGLTSYLRTFAIYWGTLIIYLTLYAGVLRGVAEAVTLAAAWAVPSHAARVRRAVELGHRALYYGGVPVFLMLRFLPW